MMKPMKRFGLALSIALSMNSAFAINLDNEVCALYEGSSCGNGTEMFLIYMREGHNTTNRDRCSRLPPICNAPDIDTWIRMYHESGGGRRGYRTSYSFSSAKVDQKGALTDLAGKSFVRCFKKRRGADWETQVVVACGVPAPQPCTNGKIMVDNECKSPTAVFDTDNSNSVHGYQVSQSLISLAAAHNNGSSQIIVNPDQTGIGGNSVPGENGNTTGVDIGSLGNSSAGSSGSAGNKPAVGSAPSGGFGGSIESSKDALSKANAALAALNPPTNVSGDAGAGSGVAGEGSALQSGQHGQSVANPDVIPSAEGTAADALAFQARSLASVGADGTGRKKTTEDPADYFTRIGLDSNLFKVVTSRLRQEQAGWILDEKPKRSPTSSGAAATAR